MNPAEDFILKKDEPYVSIMLYVRQILFKTLSEIDERYKYRLPFYYYKNRPFCYFNIAKSNSEISKKGQFVDVCFMKGHQMQNKNLIAGNDRKLVKSIPYFSLEEVNPQILQGIVLEASNFY